MSRFLILLFLAACTTTAPQGLASMQAEVAREMGIGFALPAPELVEAYTLSADGRTLARTSCLVRSNVVAAIRYRADVDWARNKAIIAHELRHAIQCDSGSWAGMSRGEREREAEATERWWASR